MRGSICLSVVSHGHKELLSNLLHSIETYCAYRKVRVIVTDNLNEDFLLQSEKYSFPVYIKRNKKPKGFGQNHNQAFLSCREDYFCVLNPDIILTSDPFPLLLAPFKDTSVGVAGPSLVDSEGIVQDNARSFPTPLLIFKKFIFGDAQDYIVAENGENIFPDWIAGMFMIFPSAIFSAIKGFDEKYYLYYEDADICMRLFLNGYISQLVSQAQAIHNARRESHKSLRYLYWHISSMVRFFLRYPFFSLRK